MRTAASVLGALALVVMLAVSAPASEMPCVGDCNGDCEVNINELILCVNIALGMQPIDACEACDCQNNGMVPINCLILSVSNSLNGCGPQPTPTATPVVTERTRNFVVGSNVAFGVGGGCNNCDNQQESCVPCINDTDCPSGQTCAPGMDLSPTGIFNGSPLGNTNAVEMLSPTTFVIKMGTPNGDGVAPLRLDQDVNLTADVFGGAGCFCLRLLAAGSSGSIDCNGGTAYDTEIFQAAGEGPAWDVTTGLGAPSGPGNANLILNGQIQFVPGQACAVAACTFPDPPVEFPFTTTKAISKKGDTLYLANQGEAFDCATFETPGTGVLVCGGAITIDPVGDTADSIRFSEMRPE
jgi:Cys-rich repeat protein